MEFLTPSHHAAVRALAFRWIRILFRCWKDRTPYDEARYLEVLQRRSGLQQQGQDGEIEPD